MWTAEAITEFWQQNKAGFSGDALAPVVLSLARRYVRGDILDVGAGSGALIERLPGAVGLDLAPRHRRIIRGTVAAIPFHDASFDVVFATDLFEHLPGDILRGGLSEIHRVLRRGGCLILVVPFAEDFNQNTVWCPHCHGLFHRWGHVNRFDKLSLLSWLSNFRLLSYRVLPLRLMASHWAVRRFWRLFRLLRLCQDTDIFAVAVKR